MTVLEAGILYWTKTMTVLEAGILHLTKIMTVPDAGFFNWTKIAMEPVLRKLSVVISKTLFVMWQITALGFRKSSFIVIYQWT